MLRVYLPEENPSYVHGISRAYVSASSIATADPLP